MKNRREGWGVYYYANGEIYAGEWEFDELFGEGIWFKPDGFLYER
jgi:hypothetical protein